MEGQKVKVVSHEEKLASIEVFKEDARKWQGRAAEEWRIAELSLAQSGFLRKLQKSYHYDFSDEEKAALNDLISLSIDAYFSHKENRDNYLKWANQAREKAGKICLYPNVCGCEECDPFREE